MTMFSWKTVCVGNELSTNKFFVFDVCVSFSLQLWTSDNAPEEGEAGEAGEAGENEN